MGGIASSAGRIRARGRWRPMAEEPVRSPEEDAEAPTLGSRLRRVVVGAPRDLKDPRLHHRLALIPLLAWVGLGADGLSSSSYGPEEAFHALGHRGYLALILAATTALTVVLISAAYARIIGDFPSGGGGYVVASKLLGNRAGVVSGCALLVDYMLTITVSVAAAGKAIFSFLPVEHQGLKLPAEVLTIVALMALNIRGVKESVKVLTPIFFLFLLTHAVVIVGGVGAHATQIPEVAANFSRGLSADLADPGVGFAGIL